MAKSTISFDLKDAKGPVIEDMIARSFMYAGEMGVAEARSKEKQNDWHDVTGNLRSSIGYAVSAEGTEISGFKPQSFNGAGEGAAEARKLLSSLSGKTRRGQMRLTMCAAMSYASDVEARGRNVLTSAGLKAGDYLRRALALLGKKGGEG